ncbi:hypothetical protein M3Y94_00467500 [Aphelenchoides besseyi]|nr:hypothetical protein M3Y94_00467500 [Aphelenchoides besseyi]
MIKINGLELCLVFTIGLIAMLASTHAMPVTNTANTHSTETAELPSSNSGIQSEFDYSRFLFKPEGGEKRAIQQLPASFGERFPGQWYQAGSLPRHLAPKFKREFGAFLPNDKRLDDQYLDDFYNMQQPGRFEWNYNRL